MGEGQGFALIQMRKSVEKLGSSAEVPIYAFLTQCATCVRNFFFVFLFYFMGLNFVDVWRTNPHEVLDSSIIGPR